MCAEEKADILFIADEIHLFPILVALGGIRIAFCRMAELLDQVSQIGVWFALDRTSQMDPYLCAVVSSKNRAVLNQRHLHAQSGRADGCAHSCDSTACYHEVVSAGVMCLAVSLYEPVPESFHVFLGYIPGSLALPREKYGVASSVEAREILERQVDFLADGIE